MRNIKWSWIICALFCGIVGGATVCAQPSPNIQSALVRYQLVQLGSARRDQYLLDTLMGELWVATEENGMPVYRRVRIER